jgi:hypothetical protein
MCFWPLFLLWGGTKVYWQVILEPKEGLELLVERPDVDIEDYSYSYNNKVYVIISKPQNSLTLSTIRQLQPARIYMAYPPKEAAAVSQIQKQLQAEHIQGVRWCEFDPFGSKEQVYSTAMECIQQIQQEEGKLLEGVCSTNANYPSKSNEEAEEEEESPEMGCSEQYEVIDGILFNPYGVITDGTQQPDTGLLALVEYKLIGNLIFLQSLLSQGILKHGSRVIFSGSESARGLPKMGFPVPDLGTTMESVEAHLTGTTYMTKPDNGQSPRSSYQWEHAYADLSAIGVLYMVSLSTRYPNLYFGTISPGMTQESLNPNSMSNPSIGWTLQMHFFRYLMFPLLKHWEIAKDVEDGAALFTRALIGADWGYPSGTFVGAKSGTGGPICDQSILSGGKVFLDQQMQRIAFEVVHRYLP